MNSHLRVRTLLAAFAITLVLALGPSQRTAWAQGKKPARDPGDFHPLTALAFSPDVKTLAVGISRYNATRGDGSSGPLGVIQLWDIETGKKKDTLATIEGREFKVYCMAFSGDGKRLAAGIGAVRAEGKHEIRVYDLKELKQTSVLHGHKSDINAVAFRPDGKQLASAGHFEAHLWDLATGRSRELKGHNENVVLAVYSPDGKTLATANKWDGIKLFDTSSGKNTKTLKDHSRDAWSLVFSSDCRTMASSGGDGITLWEVPPIEFKTALKPWVGAAPSIALSPDAKHLAVGGWYGYLYDLKANKRTMLLLKKWDYVQAVAFAPDGKSLIGVSSDGMGHVWDVATAKVVRRWDMQVPK